MLKGKCGAGDKKVTMKEAEGYEGLAERKLGVGMEKMGNKIEENHSADGNKGKEFRNLIHSVTYLFSKHSMSTYYISSTVSLKEANVIKYQHL